MVTTFSTLFTALLAFLLMAIAVLGIVLVFLLVEGLVRRFRGRNGSGWPT